MDGTQTNCEALALSYRAMYRVEEDWERAQRAKVQTVGATCEQTASAWHFSRERDGSHAIGLASMQRSCVTRL